VSWKRLTTVLVAAIVIIVAASLAGREAGDGQEGRKAAQPTAVSDTASAEPQPDEVSTFTLTAGTPTPGRQGQVLGTLDDGTSGSFPVSGSVAAGDILEYERRVTASGDVQVRFLRNLTEEARETKRADAQARNAQYADGDTLVAEWGGNEEDSLPLVGDPGKKLWSYVTDTPWEAQLTRTYDLAGNLESEQMLADWIGRFWINYEEMNEALERGEPVPDRQWVYAITWGAESDSGYSTKDGAAKLIRIDGVWYLDGVSKDYSKIIKLTEAALAELERQGQVPDELRADAY
jgi:hypothetical protein